MTAIEAILRVNTDTAEGRALVEQLARGEPVPIRVELAVTTQRVAPEPMPSVQKTGLVELLMQQYLLTEAEAETIVSTMEGRKRKAIAEKLQVSIYTINWYWRQIYAKLAVQAQPEAIAKARRLVVSQRSEAVR
ncbi:MAG TPA: helix-turn-helix transcriptional regulator [Roseiflexaceae bacterium]|nr:helix-turn-helix transcriptional regulator [Roseiflexaceae bacterium]